MSKQSIPFQLICLKAPSGHFGLQDKQEDLLIAEPVANNALLFSFELSVKQTNDGKPNFTGDYAHGSVKERFLYLTLKAQNPNQSWRIVQRSKVHLKSITWAQIESLLATPDTYLVAQIEADKTGSVPLLGDGWLIKTI